MLEQLSWSGFSLPPAAMQWRIDVERASGLTVLLLRDDGMVGSEGEARSEPGLRAVVLGEDGNTLTVVHELGHLKLETLGWPHCYLCHEDPAWIDRHYALLSDLVSLVEHRAFFPLMLRMGLDPYAASAADLADPDVLAELRDVAPMLPLAGLEPDWAITMQLLRTLLETPPPVAAVVMAHAAHLLPETRMAQRLAATICAEPLDPAGFRQAMRRCWAILGRPADTLSIGEEPGAGLLPVAREAAAPA